MNPKYITRFFILFFLIIMLFGSTANAEIINLKHSFILTTDGDGTNPFELGDDDIATVNITIDNFDAYGDSDLDTGLTTYNYFNDGYLKDDDTFVSFFSLSFDFGNTSFEMSDDDWWNENSDHYWPAVTLSDDGSINNISFKTTADDDSYTINIGVDEPGDPIILTASAADGSWSITGNPVPEPGTLILLGFGLFSLAGLHRKRSLK